MKLLKFIILVCIICITNIFISCAEQPYVRTIYLTSDDGPLNGTENVISVMEETKTPITMFMVGEHYETTGNKLRSIVDKAKKSMYIEIENHSYSHAHNHYRHFYHELDYVIADLKKNNKVFNFKEPYIVRLPGRDVFRIPGISRNDPYISKAENSLEIVDNDTIYKKGFYIYGWDLEWAHTTHGKPIQSIDLLISEIDSQFNNNKTLLPNKLILPIHNLLCNIYLTYSIP